MNKSNVSIGEIKLFGLDLGYKTKNENGQSGIDGGNLWQKFEKGDYAAQIPEKTGDEIYAVYYGYEGDYTQPFRYFIGCRAAGNAKVPEGMDSLTIPAGTYRKIIAKGEMPGCIINAWKMIWASDLQRSYSYDFEIYDERSKDWSDAEIDVYFS